MRKSEYKANWAVRIAGILLCLTLTSSCLLSGLYARYSTQAVGSASARVAAFRVTTAFAEPQTVRVNLGRMTPGSSGSYTFSVTNDSEVKIQNIIKLTATNNLPLSFQLDGEAVSSGSTVTTSALSYGQTAAYTLTVSWNEGEIDAKYANEVDALWVTVTSEQID